MATFCYYWICKWLTAYEAGEGQAIVFVLDGPVLLFFVLTRESGLPFALLLSIPITIDLPTSLVITAIMHELAAAGRIKKKKKKKKKSEKTLM
jgi:hypothetical protein